jgi:hypothetical protein
MPLDPAGDLPTGPALRRPERLGQPGRAVCLEVVSGRGWHRDHRGRAADSLMRAPPPRASCPDVQRVGYHARRPGRRQRERHRLRPARPLRHRASPSSTRAAGSSPAPRPRRCCAVLRLVPGRVAPAHPKDPERRHDCGGVLAVGVWPTGSVISESVTPPPTRRRHRGTAGRAAARSGGPDRSAGPAGRPGRPRCRQAAPGAGRQRRRRVTWTTSPRRCRTTT